MAIDSQVLQQASNPNTPPEQLRELADCEDSTIRQLVVANPNTPTEVLWRLGKEFPAQLLENLVLPLLCLEHINLIQKIPQTTLIRLFELETVPDYLQQGLLKAQVEVRVAIASNPNTSVHWLEQLAQDPQVEVRVTIANNPNTPLEILKSLGKDNTDRVRRAANLQREAIARNPNTPVHLLEQLAQDPQVEVRREIAANLNTPVHWLEQLAQDPQVEVRVTIASNPNTPLEILKSLGKDNTDRVCRAANFQREAIAANPNTPVHLLEQLAQDLEWTVRRASAANLNTPVHWLERLAQDPDTEVRQEIAANPNTPVHCLEQLAQDPGTEVRRAIAANPNTPMHWLEQLAQDPEWTVRWMIAKEPNTPVPFTGHSHFSTQCTKMTDAQILIASLRDLGIAVKTNADVRGDNGQRVRVDVVAVLEGKYDIGWSLNSDGTYDLITDLWGIAQKHNQTELINSINQKYAINKAYAASKKRSLTTAKFTNKCPRCNSRQIKKYGSIQGK